MAKRLLDEVVSGDGVSARKKRRESRKGRLQTGNMDPLTTSQHALQHGDTANGQKRNVLQDSELIYNKVEKRKQKEIEKLEKLQLLDQNAGLLPQEPANSEDDVPMNKAARKAARKAAKQAARAERKAKREEKDSNGEDESVESQTQTPTTTTAGSDSALSLAQTNAHTPEPSTTNNGTTARPNCGYSEDPGLTSLSQEAIDSYLSTNFIAITDPVPSSQFLRPILSFQYLPVTDEAQLAPFKSFSSPTPIQAAAWPSLFAGRDVIGVAETGSGKTLAFAVPCIRYINSLPKSKRSRGAKAVIVSPTRELALQIHEQILKLAGPAGLEVVCVYGGVQKEEQRKALKTASIIVATPGRLNDLISEGVADLSKVGYLVLDEADRMLDKGRLSRHFTPP
jgi:ATP-dependent RNA helicase DBP3